MVARLPVTGPLYFPHPKVTTSHQNKTAACTHRRTVRTVGGVFAKVIAESRLLWMRFECRCLTAFRSKFLHK